MILDNLKKLMKRDHINQSALARTIGRDRSAVSLMFKGKRRLTAEEAKKIATTYNWNIEDFFWALESGKPLRVTEKTEAKVMYSCMDIISRITADIGLDLSEENKFSAAVSLYQAAKRIIMEKLPKDNNTEGKEKA